MSTRAIREVLEAFAATMSEQEKETHAAALAEVEAIEKAATDIMTLGSGSSEKLKAFRLLKRIWEGVPKT